MAGDWIKMRSDLFTHPKVVRISSALNADRLRTIGALHAAWCLFDVHSTDGQLEGYTPEVLDEYLHWAGFSNAMARVGWLEINETGLIAPNFDEHNGQTAKRRVQEAERKRVVRKVSAKSPQENGQTSACDADKKRTREEKIREEKIEDIPAKQSRNAIALATYLEECKSAGVKPIPENDPVFDYAKGIGLPDEFLRLHWMEFKQRYTENPKRYKKWPQVFSNSVRGNWFRLWYANHDGGYALTTTGIQAQKLFKGEL